MTTVDNTVLYIEIFFSFFFKFYFIFKLDIIVLVLPNIKMKFSRRVEPKHSHPKKEKMSHLKCGDPFTMYISIKSSFVHLKKTILFVSYTSS